MGRFPFGPHDDLVDTCSMTILLRQMFWLEFEDEGWDDDPDPQTYPERRLYG